MDTHRPNAQLGSTFLQLNQTASKIYSSVYHYHWYRIYVIHIHTDLPGFQGYKRNFNSKLEVNGN